MLHVACSTLHVACCVFDVALLHLRCQVCVPCRWSADAQAQLFRWLALVVHLRTLAFDESEHECGLSRESRERLCAVTGCDEPVLLALLRPDATAPGLSFGAAEARKSADALALALMHRIFAHVAESVANALASDSAADAAADAIELVGLAECAFPLSSRLGCESPPGHRRRRRFAAL